MEMEKKKIHDIAADAGKSVTSFLSKTKESVVQAVDQNNDGTLDFKDVTAVAEAIGNAAKNKAAAFKESAETRNREMERAQLQPIFEEDIEGAEFALPKLIRVTDIDNKHAESDVCKGSVGYYSDQKELRIVNIFKDKVAYFGLKFYPDLDSEMYYIDPSNRDHYIALDKYFTYLKIMRVNELQRIAQDLGAKHFRVIYKEKNASNVMNNAKGKVNAKVAGNKLSADAEHSATEAEKSCVEIAAENIFPGHKPVQPKLHYLQKEPAIQNLISMRMDETSPLMHESFSLALSNSSGMKEKDAAKIDAALKSMKLAGNVTMVNEVKNESCRFFEYEIDF